MCTAARVWGPEDNLGHWSSSSAFVRQGLSLLPWTAWPERFLHPPLTALHLGTGVPGFQA